MKTQEKTGVHIPAGHYVSATEAAEIVGVTKDAITKRIARGRLPACNVFGFHLIDVEDLANFADQRRTNESFQNR